jgi:hypothetical protein
MDVEKLADQEEELCYLVANILFTVLWRGVDGASKEAWKVSVVMWRTWLNSELSVLRLVFKFFIASSVSTLQHLYIYLFVLDLLNDTFSCLDCIVLNDRMISE